MKQMARTTRAVARICEMAAQLHVACPPSLLAALHKGCFCSETTPTERSSLLRFREAMPCVTVAPSDIVPALLGLGAVGGLGAPGGAAAGGAPPSIPLPATACRYELLDCRSSAEFAARRMEGSHHLDPANLGSKQVMPDYNGYYGNMVSIVRSLNLEVSDDASMPVHLCFFGRATDPDPAALEDEGAGEDIFALEYAVLWIQVVIARRRGVRHEDCLPPHAKSERVTVKPRRTPCPGSSAAFGA